MCDGNSANDRVNDMTVSSQGVSDNCPTPLLIKSKLIPQFFLSAGASRVLRGNHVNIMSSEYSFLSIKHSKVKEIEGKRKDASTD